MEPWRLSATQAVLQIRQGELTVVQYATSLLDRKRERDAAVHAWVHLDESQVLEAAAALDRVPTDERGPLHGLPIGVKDVMLTYDMPTQYNSRLYETTKPIGVDAAPVATLRSKGALILGKLSTTEFATTAQGGWHQNRTANAHDAGRTPGGSSSGSGAAVADFQVPIALGTQTGGSIIRPASFNGCYGWKPTWGVISREGLAQWCVTLDTCGFFARTVEDLQLMADVFGVEDDEYEALESRSSLSDTRIAFCRTPYWSKAQQGTQRVMAEALDILRAHGAICTELELPNAFGNLQQWHANILAGEGKASFLNHYLKDQTLLHDQLRGYVQNRSKLTNKELCDAYDGCATLRPAWDEIASHYDVVIAPSVPDEAPTGLHHTGDMSLCSMWTALHVPVVNVPGLEGDHALPIGVTLVGGRYKDRAVLRMARLVGDAFAAIQ